MSKAPAGDAGDAPAVAEQLRILTSGTAEVLPQGALAERLAAALGAGRPLRVKLGIDPSSAHLTLGHAVVLRKLAQFQRLGHTVVLIIGSFTGMIGDPSGRSQTRKRQSQADIDTHTRTYLDQVAKILDVRAAEVRWNAEWLAPMTFAQVADLAANLTVAQLLEREDFRARYRAKQPISLVEFLYPLMQGYDSVAISADVQPGQIVLTMPLLRGTDGVQKMSKSLDNGIYLDEPPNDQFGKLMRIPDQLMPEYLRLCADLHPDEVETLIAAGAGGGSAARDVKRRLAREVTALYHGDAAAVAAEAAFDVGVHLRDGEAASPDGQGGVSNGVTELPIPASAVGQDGSVWVVALLAEAALAASRSKARQLVRQGAVRLDGQQVDSEERSWPLAELDGRVLSVGRQSPRRLKAVR